MIDRLSRGSSTHDADQRVAELAALVEQLRAKVAMLRAGGQSPQTPALCAQCRFAARNGGTAVCNCYRPTVTCTVGAS